MPTIEIMIQLDWISAEDRLKFSDRLTSTSEAAMMLSEG